MGPTSRGRLAVLHVLVVSLLLCLAARLWYLQVMSGDTYTKVAADNRLRQVVVPAVRGDILDDVGRPLVSNRTALVVSVDQIAVHRQADGGKAVLHRLAKVLHTSYKHLSKQIRECAKGVKRPCWPGSPYQPIPVDEHVSTKTALQILERPEDFPGISAQVQAVRQYPQPEGADPAQVLGYLQPVTADELKNRKGLQQQYSGVDEVGRAGLEAQYDKALRGVPGDKEMTVDASGQVTGVVKQKPAETGDQLITGIDAKVQAVTERAVSGAVRRARKAGAHPKSAAGVVLNVRTGQVVAMASWPSYDPSVWNGGISQAKYEKLLSPKHGQPLVSRATQGQYAPGSTFKISSTDAAVADGYSTAGPYQCSGSFNVGGHVFHNDVPASQGGMNLHRALVVSCDTVFYRLAYRMWKADGGSHPVKHPKDPMQKMARKFGFGKPTGIDLPNESSGRVPDRKWKYDYWKANRSYDCKHAKNGFPKVAATNPSRARYLKGVAADNCQDGYVWLPGDAVNFSIGQGDVLVTPLQLANAYAALANGGTLRAPRIAKALVRPDGTLVKKVKSSVIGHLPNPHHVLAYIRHALADVTRSGTGAAAFAGFPLNKIPVAGKTGTAEVYGQKDNSWFASFAPADHPQFAVVAMVAPAGFGAQFAAPAVREIYDGIYGVKHGHIDPKKAAFPDGKPPKELPTVAGSGRVTPPSGYPAAYTPGRGNGSGNAIDTGPRPVFATLDRRIGWVPAWSHPRLT